MALARVLAVLGVLLCASASGARAASARAAVPVPVAAGDLAAAVDSGNRYRSLVLLDLIRILFDAAEPPAGEIGKKRAVVLTLLRSSPATSKETVPLPLAPSLWREAILERSVPDAELIAEIFSRRETALLYYGLSALDDETLAWLSSDRELLSRFRKHAGAFAAFARSVRVREGRVVVPGGAGALKIWRQLVGADPAKPGAFVRALFQSDGARTAFLYDTIAHLDPLRQQVVMSSRLDALATVFRDVAPEWDVEGRPFSRPQLDPSLLLFAVRVERDGSLAGPTERSLWERVYRDDGATTLRFREFAAWRPSSDEARVDVAWLAARINEVTYTVGRRRLDTFLYAQRVFAGSSAEPHVIAGVLWAFASMPALMLTLERMGVRDAAALVTVARHASSVSDARDGVRDTSISVFQSAVAIVERGVRSRAVSPGAAQGLIESLVALPADRGYGARVAGWIRADLFRAAPQPPLESSDPVEEAVLAMLAGTRSGRPRPLVEWEGQKYLVDPAAAELFRLRRVRGSQGGLSLDAAINGVLAARGSTGRIAEDPLREFAITLRSVVYASHLGDPEGPAVIAGNVALKHDFGLGWAGPISRPTSAWKLPSEKFGGPVGWHVQGSLLALDHALPRLSLRRLDPAQLPEGPTMPVLERRTAMCTATLVNAHALTDEERDLVAAALARGRARLKGLGADPSVVESVLADAGLSEWRLESLKWAIAHAPEEVSGAFSVVEVFWLGGGAELHEWGAAAQPLTGCLCLAMPRAVPWENFAGRPISGLQATLGVDVNLRVAEALAARGLPASLLPGVLAFAMQDVLDEARPAFFDDWAAFCRTARAIADDRIDDYVAALASDGPLVPATRRSLQERP